VQARSSPCRLFLPGDAGLYAGLVGLYAARRIATTAVRVSRAHPMHVPHTPGSQHSARRATNTHTHTHTHIRKHTHTHTRTALQRAGAPGEVGLYAGLVGL
jgi:hypothetical protein